MNTRLDTNIVACDKRHSHDAVGEMQNESKERTIKVNAQ